MIADTARWGRGWWTRDKQWQAELTRLQKKYFPRHTARVIRQLRKAGYYPLEAPEYSQQGGMVPAGFNLDISSEGGTIYYTADNTDPRLPGGDVAPSAQVYTGPITVSASTTIKARVHFKNHFSDKGTKNNAWSAINEARFIMTDTKKLR